MGSHRKKGEKYRISGRGKGTPKKSLERIVDQGGKRMVYPGRRGVLKGRKKKSAKMYCRRFR